MSKFAPGDKVKYSGSTGPGVGVEADVVGYERVADELPDTTAFVRDGRDPMAGRLRIKLTNAGDPATVAGLGTEVGQVWCAQDEFFELA